MISRLELERLARQARSHAGRRAGVAEVTVPKGGVVEFAVTYLGINLFPIQALILKVITLSFHLLTEFDHRQLAKWMSGFQMSQDGTSFEGRHGTTPDLYERMRRCTAMGRSMFRHVVLVVGRRGSKSLLSAILVAWRAWNLLALGDPHRHYQIPRDKSLSIYLFGADRESLRQTGFADVAGLIRKSEWFEPFVGKSSSVMISLLTPAQLAAGARAGIDLGAIQIVAAATTATAARGPAIPMLWFDEIAFLVGRGATVDGSELAGSAMPAMAQFDADGIAIESSTPWGRQGHFFESYVQGLAVIPESGEAKDPASVVIQLPSDAPYEHTDVAGDLEMWPGGPKFRSNLIPKITRAFIEMRRTLDPQRVEAEFEAQFVSAGNSYLLSHRVEAAFGPWKGVVLAQQYRGSLGTRYVGHADPSKSGANFALAIAHLEWDDDAPHVVYDLLHVWRPTDFPDHEIDYLDIQDQLLGIIRDFRLALLTFDQFNSVMPIQSLRRQAPKYGVDWAFDIHERTATRSLNWSTAEVFKKAVHMGLVHAPPHDLARKELLGVTVDNDRILAPTSAEVRTKDMFDAMAGVAYTLLNDYLGAIDDLRALSMRASLPGGIPSSRPRSDPMAGGKFSAAGRTAVALRGTAGSNPARGRRQRSR